VPTDLPPGSYDRRRTSWPVTPSGWLRPSLKTQRSLWGILFRIRRRLRIRDISSGCGENREKPRRFSKKLPETENGRRRRVRLFLEATNHVSHVAHLPSQESAIRQNTCKSAILDPTIPLVVWLMTSL